MFSVSSRFLWGDTSVVRSPIWHSPAVSYVITFHVSPECGALPCHVEILGLVTSGDSAIVPGMFFGTKNSPPSPGQHLATPASNWAETSCIGKCLCPAMDINLLMNEWAVYYQRLRTVVRLGRETRENWRTMLGSLYTRLVWLFLISSVSFRAPTSVISEQLNVNVTNSSLRYIEISFNGELAPSAKIDSAQRM